MTTGRPLHPRDLAGKRGGEAPEDMRIRLLGDFAVSVGSRTIADSSWRLRKAAGLVKLLALTEEHCLHRERVMDLLWPNLGTKAASNNLRGTLHAARRILDPRPSAAPHYLVISGEQLVLCPGGRPWIDIEAFEEAASAARRSGDPAAFRSALGLYGGELLPGDYEAWTEGRREALRREYLALLVEIAGLYDERCEYEPAIEALGRAVEEAPTDQEAHAAFMRLYALSGRPERALAQYERLRGALSREPDGQPSPKVRRLRDDIASGRHGSEPSAATSPPLDGSHNLPVPRTSFVGRGQELREVGRLLYVTRLLTLTGAGGSGKTRLALEAARGAVEAYPGGVWFVRLAPLADPELVTQAVVEVLGVPEQTGRPLFETLAEALNARGKTLLLLDSCEHLVDATARLVEALLGSCPDLSVLATSREALLVAGETNWPVPPLALPETGPGALSLRGLHKCESARLFAERATHRSSTFTLAGTNARAVADICRKLDGIPLAIELAAARTETLSVQQISARLSDSLKLLAGGGEAISSRHQTLRGTLDWSYDLLEEPEKRLFARLSVFAGGWTLEAAEAVGVGQEIQEDDVLDLISRLTDKSLVMIGTIANGTARYRMLEPIRQYAGRKLRQNGEAEEVRSRHTAFFLALAEEAEPEPIGPQQGSWVERLEGEYDNLRAALSWVLDREEDDLGLRFGVALWRFWFNRGYLGEGTGWLRRVLASGDSKARTRVKALEGLGWFLQFKGELDRAESTYKEMLDLSRELGDREGLATALNSLGVLAMTRGDNQRARTRLEENLSVLGTLERGSAATIRKRYHVFNLLGALAINEEDYPKGVALWEQSLTLARELGDTALVRVTLSNLAYAAVLQGDYERATAQGEEALTLVPERGSSDADYFPETLVNLGLAALGQGNHERARSTFLRALTLARKEGRKATIINVLEGMMDLAAAREMDIRAAWLWGAAETGREATGIALAPGDLALHEPYLASVRSRLEESAWEEAVAEGRATSLDEAAGHALEQESTPPMPTEPVASETAGNLSRREREVVALVARGLTNRQISAELSISERTAANHVARILRKLHLHSRTQIATWATEQDLLGPEQN